MSGEASVLEFTGPNTGEERAAGRERGNSGELQKVLLESSAEC